MQTYLGVGNSNIFYFHPEIWGCMIPKFDYIMFFKWVGSTTNQITATSQPQPIRVFQKKRAIFKAGSTFSKAHHIWVSMDWIGRVDSRYLRKVTQEQLHVLEQFLAADLPAWGSQEVVPHDAGWLFLRQMSHFQRDF